MSASEYGCSLRCAVTRLSIRKYSMNEDYISNEEDAKMRENERSFNSQSYISGKTGRLWPYSLDEFSQANDR